MQHGSLQTRAPSPPAGPGMKFQQGSTEEVIRNTCRENGPVHSQRCRMLGQGYKTPWLCQHSLSLSQPSVSVFAFTLLFIRLDGQTEHPWDTISSYSMTVLSQEAACLYEEQGAVCHLISLADCFSSLPESRVRQSL